MQGNEPADINRIAYDAPLSFQPPSQQWCDLQAKRDIGVWLDMSAVPASDLSGKWVLITGSNNGIGREAALTFARWGANLVLGCRDPPPTETHPASVVEECKTAAKKAGHLSDVEWWQLNMADLTSVEAFARKWLDTGRPLDILCNNAGMGSSPGGDKVFKTKDGFEIIHQVRDISTRTIAWAG